MKKTLAILLPLLAVGWYFGLGGCLFTSGRNELRSSSMDEYMKSDVASRIVIPSSSKEISTFRLLGFDTNYRYLMATVQPESTDLADLCAKSIALQPVETNSTFTTFTNINMAGFEALFGGIPRSAPSWWDTDETQFDQQYLCTWETTNHYGHGYLFLLNSKKRQLRVFQWIQQWNTVARTKEALENEVEQGGPGYPPQGVDFPDP